MRSTDDAKGPGRIAGEGPADVGKRGLGIAAALAALLCLVVLATQARAADATVTIYRLYNPYLSGAHMLTSDRNEYDTLVGLGWKGEGEAFRCYRDHGVGIYRLYNPNNGDHHWTTSRNEYEQDRKAGWRGEGVVFYGAESRTGTPVYRLWNAEQTDLGGLGSHLWTTDANEYNSLPDLTHGAWRKEDVAWYGVPPYVPDPDVPSVFDPSLTDTDGDRLPDAQEREAGTNLRKPDTDGDGMDDYTELFYTMTDPLEPNDFDGDADDDGLSDEEEVNVHLTDPNHYDTDRDGLTDDDELWYYETLANDPDTDDDGLSDGFEVDNDLDPLDPMTDGVTPDAEVPVEQDLGVDGISPALLAEDNVAVPSLSGEVAGEMSDSVFLSSSDDRTLDENRAVVGKPVTIYEEDFAPDLTLAFDLDAYDGDADGLALYRLTEAGGYEEVPSSCDGWSIWTELTAPGTYFLMDPITFLEGLGFRPEASFEAEPTAVGEGTDANPLAAEPTVSGQADIAFVIDTTTSMDTAIENVIENVTSFAETLARDYNVQTNYALITYGDYTYHSSEAARIVKNGSSDWYTDTEGFVESVRAIRTDGGGDPDECSIDALELARRLNWRVSSSKFVVLITDAQSKTNNNYGVSSLDEEALLLSQAGINASVISDTWNETYYNPIYNGTGGLFASIYGDFSSVLLDLADLVGEDTSSGEWVILEHGFRYVRLPRIPTDPDDPTDTDGDGLTDYEELGEKKTVDLTDQLETVCERLGIPFEDYDGPTRITVYVATSDPSTPDSDDDGIWDDEDNLPWVAGTYDPSLSEPGSSWASGKDHYVGDLRLVSTISGTSLGLLSNTGHTFIVFESAIKQTVDFTEFNHGYSTATGSWVNARNDTTLPSRYKLQIGEVVALAANGTDDFDASCAVYNAEFFKHFAPKLRYSYRPNAFLERRISKADFEKLMAYFAGQNDEEYSALFYNCTNVAMGCWDKLFDTGFGRSYDAVIKIPGDFKAVIERRSDSKSDFNLDDYIQ